MYLTKNASTVLISHFPDFQQKMCEKCQFPPDAETVEVKEKPRFDPTILALKILNRCFTYQIEAIILNQTEDLLKQVVEETRRDQITLADFQVEKVFTDAVVTRMMPELAAAKNTFPQSKINFDLLY